MMLTDIYLPYSMTHVGRVAKVKNNQRRFAPTLAHITVITGPHHRNTQLRAPEWLRGAGFEPATFGL
jgi:hypothetical protein